MGKADSYVDRYGNPASSSRHHAYYQPYDRPTSLPAAGPSSGLTLGGAADNSIALNGAQKAPRKRATPRKKPEDGVGPDGQSPEKRLARWKPVCPKNILERVDRVMSQRFFMVDRSREGENLREEFQVLGSTGNVYTVVIDRMPTCSCPDSQKGNHCKHILFVFLKVLGQRLDSAYYYQKALLTYELEQIFSQAPAAPNNPDAMTARIRAAYAEATGKAPDPKDVEGAKGKKRLPSKDDSCPVCYEDFEEGQEAGLVFCLGTCGGGLHAECHQQWASTERKKGNPVLCVYCRSPWLDTTPPVAGASGSQHKGVVGEDGYLNLGAAAGVSPQRDTSSYYYGPRRGDRYEPGIYVNRYL